MRSTAPSLATKQTRPALIYRTASLRLAEIESAAASSLARGLVCCACGGAAGQLVRWPHADQGHSDVHNFLGPSHPKFAHEPGNHARQGHGGIGRLVLAKRADTTTGSSASRCALRSRFPCSAASDLTTAPI